MITCRCLYYLRITKRCSYLVERITYPLRIISGMGFCEQVHDNMPNGFFMVDCYRRHDKYTGLKHEEWLAFAVVDVAEVEKEIGD